MWIETTDQTSYPALTGQAPEVDVAIVGAGITGLIAATMLQREGARVAVIEAGRICNGTTGHTTAKVTSQHGLCYSELSRKHSQEVAAVYADAQQAGLNLIASLASDIDCAFVRAPACVYTTDPSKITALREEAEAARAAGLPARIEATAPSLPFTVACALFFDDQAMFHPRAFCLGLVRSLAEGGAAVYESSRVVDVSEDGLCTLKTDGEGTLRARDVILATHLPFPGQGKYYAKTSPYQSYAIAIEGVEFPDEMYISADEPVRSLRVSQWQGERLLIVGGENHRTGEDGDTKQHYTILEQWASERFGPVAVRHRWSAHDYMPIDHIPFIGPMSGDSEHVWVATGFRKWGMTNGAVAGLILRDAIGGRPNDWAEVFDSRRSGLKDGGLGPAISGGIAVGSHLVGGRLRAMHHGSFADLPEGSAKVFTADGEKVAAYREPGGTLHAVSAKCTHMGCIVEWNNAKTTWDCPCHGSRFAPDGGIIEGPATKPLENFLDRESDEASE
ncbi:MAG: FAD-dependent oxidoreductase [Actinomycetota bacterium]